MTWRRVLLIVGVLAVLIAAPFVYGVIRAGMVVYEELGRDADWVVATAGDLRVEAWLQTDPPRQSGNEVTLIVSRAGELVGDDVTVYAFMPQMGAMPEMRSQADVDYAGTGVWRARFDLEMGGSWTLRVESGGQTASFSFTVGSPGLIGTGVAVVREVPVDLPDVVLSEEALRDLRAAFLATDGARDQLAQDRLDGLPVVTGAIAMHLEAAAVEGELATWTRRGAREARSLGEARDLETARSRFGELSRALLAVASADVRLTEGLHVFSCPMVTDGFPKWFETDPTLDNPYMGRRMPGCGVGTDWTVTAEAPSDGVVIDASRRQQFGIRTSPALLRELTKEIRAVGLVAWDETAMVDVALTTGGWIRELRVDQTGQRVKKGDVLFVLYSPDLFVAEQEWLTARERGESDPLAQAARKKLLLLGLTSKQVDDVTRRGEASTEVPILSPVTGYVLEKSVVEGSAFAPGDQVFRIAPLGEVWVEADVYSSDVPHVSVGQIARVTMPDDPDHAYEATVDLLHPAIGVEEHTRKVRLRLANADERLLPGMYAEVRFAVPLGERVVVPESAIVYAGDRRIAFVDAGDGRLVPREVEIGARAEGVVEILAGVEAGEEVVSSGTFLVAAESRLSAATSLWETE